MSKKQSIRSTVNAVPFSPISIGVTFGLILLMVAALAPLPSVWVLGLYVAALLVAGASVIAQRERNRR